LMQRQFRARSVAVDKTSIWLEMRNGQLSELTGEERDAASRDAVARTA
ncbi:hypothetical protein ACUOFC_61410, partial [Escherichia sp. TWPC-MK]